MKIKLFNLWFKQCDIHFLTVAIISNTCDGKRTFNIIILNLLLEMSFNK